MLINNITHLFKEVPLYKKEIFKYCKKEDGKDIIDFDVLDSLYNYLNLNDKENLITKCVFCGFDELVFKQNCYFDSNDYTDSHLKLFEARIGDISEYFYLGHGYNKYKNQMYSFTENGEFRMTILRYIFVCSNDNSHLYFMNLLLVKHDGFVEITKIGQYPESTILSSNKLERKYEKILKKINALDDFKNAVKSKQYALDVGAYDYERRILEKIVNYYLAEHKRSDLVGKACRFEDKYDVIKADFDPSIQQFVLPLYSALSGGVHFMPDNECAEYFEDLSNLINIQLEYMLLKDERDISISSSAGAIGKLNERYPKIK